MKKLITTIFIAVLIISLSAIAFYFWFGSKKDIASEAIQAIPTDASFILKVNDYHRLSSNLRSNNLVWNTLKEFHSIEKVDSIIAFIDTLSNRSGSFTRLISQGQIYISAHTEGKLDYEFLAAIKLPEQTSKKDIFGLISDYTNKGINVKGYDYNDINITTIIDTRKTTELVSIAYFHGIIIFASNKQLLESSIKQLNSQTSLLDDSNFKAISLTAGTKVDANLYINSPRIPVSFRKFINKKYQTGVGTLSDIAMWSELDITLNDESISFSGFSQAPDFTNSFLKVLSRQHPVESKIASVIPSQTAAFVSLGISDLDLYLENYRSYLDKTGHVLEYTSSLSKAKKELGFDIHELYRSFLNKEIALVFIPFDGTETQNCWFVVARTNGQSQTKQTLNNIINTYAKSNRLQKSSFRTIYKIDKEKSAEIMRLPIRGLNALLFGSLFSEVSDEYYTFIDDFIVFGASSDALSKIILSNIHNKQLQLDISYRQFSDVLATESNYFIYLNPGKAEKLYSTMLDSCYASTFLSHHSTTGKIQGISVQLNGGNNMIFNSINIKYSPSIVEDAQTNWETRLDTSFTTKPQLLINHYTKNREIVVLDLKNKFYLINDVGRILWSKQLKESIIGEVSQVDLFKNGKLQFLFNTPNYLYAIDRKGDFVEGFPVKLRSRATNPVAIFDYDNTRDYRFLVAAYDKKIYAFNSKGKPLTGWAFGKTEKIVSNQLQHFRVKGKDYVVFADVNRLYIIDRKGEERTKFSRYFSKSLNSSFVFEDATKNHTERLVTTDSLGLIRFIYFNGKVEDLAIKAFSSKHFFDFQDVDSDGEKDFIFLDNKQLFVYRQNKSLILSYRFDKDVIPGVLFFNFSSSNHKLGVVSSTGNEIYLISENGSLYEGFPLNGNTFFSIGQFSDKQTNFNLFVGSSSGSLMNYTIK